MRPGGQADIFGIGGRNGFGHLVPAHPVDSHGLWTAIDANISGDSDEAAIGPMLSPVLAAAVDTVDMPWVVGLFDGKAAFEVPVPVRAQTEHGAAQHQILANRGTWNVLDDKWLATCQQATANRFNQIGIMRQIFPGVERAEFLARGACPYEIKAIQRKCCGIGTVESKRIARLRLNINACHIKSRAMQPHAGTASAAEQIYRFQGSQLQPNRKSPQRGKTRWGLRIHFKVRPQLRQT